MSQKLAESPIFTEDNYYNLPENIRAELIDGQFYNMSAPSRIHQEILMEPSGTIRDYIRTKKGPCKIYPAPFAVKLFDRDTTIVEPDITVVCDQNKLTDRGCSRAPDWVIDDDVLAATALTTILEAQGSIQVCATGTDGSDALELYKTHRPDVLLMDIRMKHIDGLAASANVLSFDPKACILLLTTFTDDEYILQALKIGVKGYILKQDYPSIVPAIEAACLGQTVFGREAALKIPGLLHKKTYFSYEDMGITKKEYEIIVLVADGLNNREIADKICLSEGTVRNYLSVILDKLDLRDRTQLAVFYYQHL